MTSGESGHERWRADVAAFLLLLAVAVVALLQSYGRWLDPIIDAGRDLYIPEQLRHGARLYISFSYLYPPLAPHLLAVLTAITGASLGGYTVIGVAIAAAVAATLYIIGKSAAGGGGAPQSSVAGFSAALLFLSLNFTGATSWGCNFVFPYAHAATLGILLLLSLELQLLRGARLLAIVFAVLATWSKLEFAVAAAMLMAAAALLRRIRWADVIAYVAANVLIFAVLDLWWFADAPGWFRANVLAPSLLTGDVAREFYRQVTGLADAGGNLRTSVEGFVLLAGAVFVVRALDRREPPAEAGAPFRVVLYVALGVIFSLLVMDDRFFRAWAIAQLGLIPLALRERRSPLPLLLLASLLMSSRIFLRISPDWYGFVYVIPLYLLIVYVLRSRLWIILFVMLAANGLFHQNQMYAFKSAPVETKRGTYRDLPHRAEVVQAFLRWSEERPDVRTFAAVPEGLALNYLAKKPTTLSRHTFTPAEMPDAAAEREAIRELHNSPPDAVVLVSRNMSEFGYQGFGIDYGRDLMLAIGERYAPAARWQSGTFSIVVLTRRP